MKTTLLNLLSASFIFLFVLGMAMNPINSMAQDATKDTATAVQDNSSSFNDSVQFDDMEPIFYEAADDDEEETSVSEDGSGMMLYVGIAVVLLIILIVLRKAGKKKS